MKKSLTNFSKTFTYLEYVVYMILLVLLLELGFWQCHRADEKQSIVKQYQLMNNQGEKEWRPWETKPQNFQKMILKGQQLNSFFYLDNQFFEHRLGYNVLFPILLEDDSVLLIDAGWLQALQNRKDLPLPRMLSQKQWSGQAYYPYSHGVQLGSFLDHQQNQIYVIESIDFDELEKLIKKPLHRWVLRLNPDASVFFKQNWQVVNLSPQRHRAYALQWFSMALLVAGIFLWRVIKHAKK